MSVSNEDIIKNTSYTNKDFNSIYSELLDLVKTQTTKWDPSLSNESDPGVVLLKENAITTDKNNYNIDKNILECFPLSVTQYGNARQLYDALGYNMHWYRAAELEISLAYNGDELEEGNHIITIPQFTMVSDESGEHVYTLIDDSIKISKRGLTYTGNTLQGLVQDFSINEDNIVRLNNLDSDLRLYFNERRVAENGIFITNDTSVNEDKGNTWEEWQAVSNLSAYPLNSKVYKFGVLPNSDTCYIQFPQDIANLIENGLRIKYIITNGEDGNIGLGEISKFYSDVIVEINGKDVTINDKTVVTNVYSSTSGENPESIEDAYKNYKRTIGTFDTLVTCRDYENAIYNLTYPDGSYMTSNSVVSDRTNDINDSYNVVTLTEEGIKKELVVKSAKSVALSNGDIIPSGGKIVVEGDGTKVMYPKMSAFDLGIYVLEPVLNINNSTDYDKTFSVNKNYDSILEALQDMKSSEHDYKEKEELSPYIFKNFYTLNGKVVTYFKVSKEEVDEIEKNIRRALQLKYNARKVEFGKEINYNDIIDTIYSADSRIKSVVLDEPDYDIRVMLGNDTEGTYNESLPISEDDRNKELLAKMILNGNVQLYKFDERFDYDFGQTGGSVVEDIETITSEVEIRIPLEVPEGDNSHRIRDNENVIIYAPNYVATESYGAYVKCKFSEGFSTISKDSLHKLANGESINITYTDSSTNSSITKTLSNVTIQPNFNITQDIVTNGHILSATDSIDVVNENTTIFENKLNCFWKVNNKDNVLFAVGSTERILESGEFFMYTNDAKNELVILGSGTKLKRTGDTSEKSHDFGTQVSKILSDGLSANIEWYQYNLGDADTLTIQELQIITLGKGTRVICTDPSPDNTTLGNEAIDVPSGFKYKGEKDTDFRELPALPTDVEWKIMSRLNIVASQSVPQKLESGQTITVKGTGYTNTSIRFSTPVALSGGIDMDARILDEQGNYVSKLAMYSYTEESPDGLKRDNGYITVNSSTTLPFTFEAGKQYIIPVIKTGDSITYTFEELKLYQSSKDAELKEPGIYYVSVNSSLGIDNISITKSDDIGDDVIEIGKIYIKEDYSDQVKKTEIIGIESEIMALDVNSKFDWVYKPNSYDTIDAENPLNPKSFFDYNNQFNKYTIPQINTKTYNIKVANSSKR